MVKERLVNLRKKMSENEIDVYYLSTQDYHMSEYIPDYFKTVKYFSGFSGSLAQLIVTFDSAYIFVDGRYHTQAENEVSQYGIEVVKLGTENALNSDEFLIKHYKDYKIGLDGKCTNTTLVKKLKKNGLNIKSINLYDGIFFERPNLRKDNLFELSDKYTGLTRNQKIDIIKRVLNNKCHIITNLEAIAYVLNLRANDIDYTPVFLSYMIIYDGDVYLFIDRNRLSDIILENLYRDGVIIKDYDEFYEFIKNIHFKTILLDENKVNYEAYKNIDKTNKIINSRSIIEEMKAIKNSIEIKNNIQAHIYDGVAMVRFMKWLKETDLEGLNEYDVKIKLNRFRLEYKAFDLSFNPIVAYNENAAMMHYSPTETNNTMLHNKGMLLVDSGGQYFEGTTDITRTFALGEVNQEVKKYFTLVLKSMFNLQNLKFLEGLCGNQIDIIARKDLWNLGVDYRCGTGHGVGQCLSVHETPPNIRYAKNAGSDTVLKPGHIFSDEPGVYFEGKFGIRCENLLLCKKDIKNEYGQFLSFKALTLVPFDLDLIDSKYLDEETIRTVNDYHQEVYDTLQGYLNDEERLFLKEWTRKI